MVQSTVRQTRGGYMHRIGDNLLTAKQVLQSNTLATSLAQMLLNDSQQDRAALEAVIEDRTVVKDSTKDAEQELADLAQQHAKTQADIEVLHKAAKDLQDSYDIAANNLHTKLSAMGTYNTPGDRAILQDPPTVWDKNEVTIEGSLNRVKQSEGHFQEIAALLKTTTALLEKIKKNVTDSIKLHRKHADIRERMQQLQDPNPTQYLLDWDNKKVAEPYQGMVFRTAGQRVIRGLQITVVEKMHQGKWVPWVGIGPSSINGAGYGLYALRPFNSLEQIGLYLGKLLSFAEVADILARLHDGRTTLREQATCYGIGYICPDKRTIQVDGAQRPQSNDEQLRDFGCLVYDTTKFSWPGCYAHVANTALRNDRTVNATVTPDGRLRVKRGKAIRALDDPTSPVADSEILWFYGKDYVAEMRQHHLQGCDWRPNKAPRI
ncbi:hypothetical protein WJX73_002342 [Symbiochloris irregularis]|uniref:SET domain-containing protein n=1 Tax=Symbiochloris irregularis TaxID=706552 RepID=A0AAW1PQG6_9CHLO